MRLHIDWTACDGRGVCTELLDLDEDDWGYPVTGNDRAIPATAEAAARMAVDQCPMLALKLTAT